MFKDTVFISGYSQSFKAFAKHFAPNIENNIKHLIKKTNKYKFIIFSGGEDIDPSMYGDTSPFRVCFKPNIKRDLYEREVFNIAVENNIPMVGICRGMQLLHVLNGGMLLHHINNHAGSMHKFVLVNSKNGFIVNSLHHQMVVPNDGCFVVGKTPNRISSVHIGKNDDLVDAPEDNVEAIVIPKFSAIGVQYHPEMMFDYSPGYLFFKQMTNDLLKLNMKDFMKKYTNLEEQKHSMEQNNG